MQTTKIVRDLLPEEVNRRKQVLQKIITVFEKYGYAEIVTPTFENYDTLVRGLPGALQESAYRFFDHTGEQMILRPDITTQIARVVATKLKQEKKPLRLYYSGDVYRTTKLEIGQHHQCHQVGIELYNNPGKKGDDEILEIAEACLKTIGLKGYKLESTNVSKIHKYPPKKKAALLKQDFVAFGRLPKKEELMAVDIDYYTGLYFECFVPEIGYILGGGGRYDNLSEIFGEKKPAVGFAFNFDKLIQALDAQKKRK